jgi:hypothetical protein
MKTKKFNKLTVKKSTIANLDMDQLSSAKGGDYSAPESTCKMCVYTDGGLSCDYTCTLPPDASISPCETENVVNCQTVGGHNTCNPAIVGC